MIPVYGFIEGDCMGILVFTYEEDTVAMLAQRLIAAAATRVAVREGTAYHVYANGSAVKLKSLVGKIGLKPLDKIEVRKAEYEL